MREKKKNGGDAEGEKASRLDRQERASRARLRKRERVGEEEEESASRLGRGRKSE